MIEEGWKVWNLHLCSGCTNLGPAGLIALLAPNMAVAVECAAAGSAELATAAAAAEDAAAPLSALGRPAFLADFPAVDAILARCECVTG